MKGIISSVLFIYLLLAVSCRDREVNKPGDTHDLPFRQGEFGYDLQFLIMKDSALVVLKDGAGQVIVSPGYQAKVFTSTAAGERGLSFGWINYKAFGNTVDSHMNAYGGENRLWLGPEGGKYSLFFAPGRQMVFENWKTPTPMDTERWSVHRKDSHSVTMFKEMNLLNYTGNRLKLVVERTIKILDRQEIIRRTGITGMGSVHAVAYETENILTNQGDREWTAATGMPCIWILDMFKPSPATVIIVPFQYSREDDFAKLATTNYFGEISSDRLKHTDTLLLFKADGKSRGKLGIVAGKAKQLAGSYDEENKVLTIILFDLDGRAGYLNQEWNITQPSFSGDAVNAYNDGPLADGSQMGPFYELESVSPAAFLKPDGSLIHRHSVFHFSGSAVELDKIALQLLGISIPDIHKAFPEQKAK
jgi:hypothetical protein